VSRRNISIVNQVFSFQLKQKDKYPMNFLRKAITYSWQNVGHCMFCMRKSFFAFLLSLVALGAATYGSMPSAVLISVKLFVTMSGTLWALHLVAYTIKTAMFAKQNGKAEHSVGRRSLDSKRRAAVANILKAFGFAAVASALPSIAWSQAYPQCNNNCLVASQSCYSNCKFGDTNCSNYCTNTFNSCQQGCCSLLPPGIHVPGCPNQ
jgi:hypothetical protein